MKVRVLASGSEGNVIYVETEEHKILFDMGMNLKYITNSLISINVDPSSIDYVFFSHVHSDHISALPTFIRRYRPTVCMSDVMFSELKDIKEYERIIIYEDDMILDDVRIECIKTSHDTKDSRGFIINSGDMSIVYMTDTGYLNQKNFERLSNKNIYMFESNHDIEKLMHGPYPIWLKKRILSDYGHLSNKDSSYYLTKLIGNNTNKIILMHLSKKNNTEELALSTIRETFKNNNIEFDNITCAKQNEILEVIG